MTGQPHPVLAAINAGKAGLMIDCTGAALPGLLEALDGRYPDVLAGYVTGRDGVDWPGAQWGELHGKAGLFRYDQTPGLALFASGAADGADIERGAGTTGAFIDAARKRAARGWYSWAYIDQADYLALAHEVKDAGIPKVQYGIANWNDSLEQATRALGGPIAYVQWASPSSNPHTAVPGTLGQRTLAEVNCDLNATLPGWFGLPAVHHPTRHGLLATADQLGNVTGRVVMSADGKTWVTS